MNKRFFIIIFSIIAIVSVYFSYISTDYTSVKSIILNWIISPVSALTGIVCVFLVAEKNIKNWIWGLINSVGYGYLALVAGIYGDVFLNWFFFVPTQFLILLYWRKRLQSPKEIKTRANFSIPGIFTLIFVVMLFTMLFGEVIDIYNNEVIKTFAKSSAFYEGIKNIVGFNAGPYLDAATVVFQIVAEILLILCFAEQWYFWIATNVINVFVWSFVLVAVPGSAGYAFPTLAMWAVFLANSIYGFVNWNKKARSLYS